MRWDQALAEFDELVAENDHFEMYWFPHTDRLLTKRNNRTLDPPSRSRVRALARRRVPRPTASSAGSTGSATPARPGPPDQRLLGPGPERAPLQRRTAQGVHLTRGPWSSARWSTPCRATSGLQALRDVRALVEPATGGSASRSRSGPSRPTTYRSPPPATTTRSTSPSTPTRRPTTAATSAGSRTSCGSTTAARTGASCTAAPPRTSSRPTPAGGTSRRCATGSTPTGSSPTPTSTGCSATLRRSPDLAAAARASRATGRAPGGRSRSPPRGSPPPTPAGPTLGEHRPGRAEQRRGRVELAGEHDRHPVGQQVARHPAADPGHHPHQRGRHRTQPVVERLQRRR